MRRATAGILTLIALIAGSSGAAWAQQEQDERVVAVLAALEDRWDNLPGLSAEFTHTWEWVLAGETQVTTGLMRLASENRFRIETEDLVLVSDGTTIWQHTPSQNQVVIDNFNPRRPNATPEQLFLAFTEESRAEWLREEGRERARQAVIRLHRSEAADPATVDAWVELERMLVVRLEYADGAGNRHRYELDDIRLTEQAQEYFRFTIPEGAIVVDLRPGGSR
jgi:outer membrane lipoprotein-sorting protein